MRPFVNMFDHLLLLPLSSSSSWSLCVRETATVCHANLKIIHTTTQDTTRLSCLRRRYELDSRKLKTVADRKSEVWTRSEQSSNSHRHTRHDTDTTVVSCLAGGVNWALESVDSSGPEESCIKWWVYIGAIWRLRWIDPCSGRGCGLSLSLP